jgi:hypothetical protein
MPPGLRQLVIWLFTKKVGLLDKANSKATLRSVTIRAVQSAVVVTAFFFLLGKPWFRAAWPITLPVCLLAGAAIGALYEWQVREDDNSS